MINEPSNLQLYLMYIEYSEAIYLTTLYYKVLEIPHWPILFSRNFQNGFSNFLLLNILSKVVKSKYFAQS